MKIAKADRRDLDATLHLLHGCELSLEKAGYSFDSPEENWLTLDEADEDYQIICKIRTDVSNELGMSEGDIDHRILMYEFLKKKFAACSSGWRRVWCAADILIATCTDPMDDCLAWHPGCQLKHVSPEQ